MSNFEWRVQKGIVKPFKWKWQINLVFLFCLLSIQQGPILDEAQKSAVKQAIARSIQTCLNLTVLMVTAIVGEGGSGGAIALATANRVVMFEHAVYSVISPEGCASILWRSAEHAQKAAEALRLWRRYAEIGCD